MRQRSQLEALVSCCFNAKHIPEDFIIAYKKIEDLIKENYASYLFSGRALPFYNHYYQKYYDDAYLAIKNAS